MTTQMIRSILQRSEVVAVIGSSSNPAKPAHRVPRRLQSRGFKIIPVNPSVAEVLGEPSYPSLSSVTECVDLVLVFRPAKFAKEIAEQAVLVGAKALWLQQGLRSEAAREIAQAAGLDYVEDRCAAIEAAIHRVDKRAARGRGHAVGFADGVLLRACSAASWLGLLLFWSLFQAVRRVGRASSQWTRASWSALRGGHSARALLASPTAILPEVIGERLEHAEVGEIVDVSSLATRGEQIGGGEPL
jgi:uncharacterized protein